MCVCVCVCVWVCVYVCVCVGGVKLSWGRRAEEKSRACSVQLEEAEMSGGVKLALHRPPPTAPTSISTHRRLAPSAPFHRGRDHVCTGCVCVRVSV